jgi:hypothetical protein
MAPSRIALLVIGVFLFAQAAPVTATPATPPADAAPVCNGKYKGSDLRFSPYELADV